MFKKKQMQDPAVWIQTPSITFYNYWACIVSMRSHSCVHFQFIQNHTHHLKLCLVTHIHISHHHHLLTCLSSHATQFTLNVVRFEEVSDQILANWTFPHNFLLSIRTRTKTASHSLSVYHWPTAYSLLTWDLAVVSPQNQNSILGSISMEAPWFITKFKVLYQSALLTFSGKAGRCHFKIHPPPL